MKKDKAKKSKTKVKAEPKKDHNVMSRDELKKIAKQVKEAGSDLKVLKKDDDATLQRKVNEALHGLPSAEVVKKLESIDPDKLVNVLKKDCIGLFIDLADVSCRLCGDVQTCATRYLANLKGDLGGYKRAEYPKLPVVEWDPGARIFVLDVDNPLRKTDESYPVVQAVIDESPETLGELRKIFERDWELSDAEFVETLASFRDPDDGQVLKCIPDLTKDDVQQLKGNLSKRDRKQLRKAGVTV